MRKLLAFDLSFSNIIVKIKHNSEDTASHIDYPDYIFVTLV